MLLAASSDEALDLLADRDATVIVCEQRAPDSRGVELLERVRERFPKLVRVLVADSATAQAAQDPGAWGARPGSRRPRRSPRWGTGPSITSPGPW